jgi:hypothetical protein
MDAVPAGSNKNSEFYIIKNNIYQWFIEFLYNLLEL